MRRSGHDGEQSKRFLAISTIEGRITGDQVRNAMRGMLNSDALEQYSAIFAAMSEPARMDILLRIADTAELACTVLDETLPISKSTISYHIKILYQAGLIEVRKEGRYYFYRLRSDVMEKMAPGLLERMLGARAGKSSRPVTAAAFAAV